MNTPSVAARLAGHVPALFALLAAGLIAFAAISAERDAVPPRVADAAAVTAFEAVPKSFRRSSSATCDEFVAGWATGAANVGRQRELALNERQIAFIRGEIAPRMNYILESNPPRLAEAQLRHHRLAVAQLVFDAR
jgi:hypothetical protein